jgi:hypothetical protein
MTLLTKKRRPCAQRRNSSSVGGRRRTESTARSTGDKGMSQSTSAHEIGSTRDERVACEPPAVVTLNPRTVAASRPDLAVLLALWPRPGSGPPADRPSRVKLDFKLMPELCGPIGRAILGMPHPGTGASRCSIEPAALSVPEKASFPEELRSPAAFPSAKPAIEAVETVLLPANSSR